MRGSIGGFVIALLASAGAALCVASAAAPASSCVQCHARLDGAMAEPVKAWNADVHAEAGLGCEGCHGGDPSPAAAEDAVRAKQRGFRPAPGRLGIAAFCGNCHADAEFMKRFDPQARIDQLAEYRTSVHGKLNASGDPVPATCTDCHGVHGIRPVSSPDSPVWAANVPRTCARCHSDREMMAAYGAGTAPYDDYRVSAHGAALLERGDTAAPACNDCHGNHGAAPPGVQSVAYVCGNCHGRETSLFRASPKKAIFETMGVAECAVCHDHHRIRHPTPSLFHGGSAPSISVGKLASIDPLVGEIGALEPGAEATLSWQQVLRPHLRPDDDRLVHRIEISAEGIDPVVLEATVRPGDSALPSADLTSGSLTASLRAESISGLPVEGGDVVRFRVDLRAGGPLHGIRVRDLPGEAVELVRGSVCLGCHVRGDACDQATERMYGDLVALDRDIRQAGALLREAEIKGMEVSGPIFELKSKGMTAAVEARALIHAFDPERLVQRSGEGRGVAAAALEAAQAALAELRVRHRGLAVSLVLVALVLIGLFLKIRQIDRDRASPPAAAGPPVTRPQR